MLLLVVGWSSLRELDEAVVWGLLGGALVDLFSATPFGTSVISLGVVSVLAGSVGPWLRQAHERLPLLLVPPATIVFYMVHGFVLELLGWRVDWPSAVTLVVLPGALLNGMAMIVVYPLLHSLGRRQQSSIWLG